MATHNNGISALATATPARSRLVQIGLADLRQAPPQHGSTERHRQVAGCRMTNGAEGWVRAVDGRDCAAIATPATRGLSETVEEAIANSEDAKSCCWIAAMEEVGRPIPAPSAEPAEGYNGNWQLRALKSLRQLVYKPLLSPESRPCARRRVESWHERSRCCRSCETSVVPRTRPKTVSQLGCLSRGTIIPEWGRRSGGGGHGL